MIHFVCKIDIGEVFLDCQTLIDCYEFFEIDYYVCDSIQYTGMDVREIFEFVQSEYDDSSNTGDARVGQQGPTFGTPSKPTIREVSAKKVSQKRFVIGRLFHFIYFVPQYLNNSRRLLPSLI